MRENPFLWTESSAPPSPASEEVHVWRIDLDRRPSQANQLAALLSEDERARAARYATATLRERFIVARGALRQILGAYLDSAPQILQFAYGSAGKPILQDLPERPSLHFNLSHSQDLALLAVCRSAEVGVDVERISPTTEVDALAERFFSAREAGALQALPEQDRRKAFFAIWTCKEAYLKALGTGIAAGLDSFDIVLRDPDQAQLQTPLDPSEAARWSVQRLFPAEDYAGALVVEGRNRRLQCLQWNEATHAR
jgi:4'-phosphopantetheinyl transferase